MNTHTINIPDFHPCTVNKLLSVHWSKRTKLKNRDKGFISAFSTGIPKAKAKRSVSFLFCMEKGQRTPDPDAMLKSALDALVHAQMLVNDSPKWCEIGSIQFSRGKEKSTVITLRDLQ